MGRSVEKYLQEIRDALERRKVDKTYPIPDPETMREAIEAMRVFPEHAHRWRPAQW